MTLSRQEKTLRAVQQAAREVAAENPNLPFDDVIAQEVEEHIGWNFSDAEWTLAIVTYREEVAKCQ